MFDGDIRLRELSNKAAEGGMTDEEFAELAQLSRAKQKLREDRAALIAGLRDSLQGQGIALGDLFSAEEISAAALQGVLTVRQRRALRVKQVQAPVLGTTWERQKKGLVLVEVNKSGNNGFPCRYCKQQLLPYYLPKSLKELDDGQLEANLERHFTDKGRVYFATDEGRAELTRLVGHIRTHDIKPPMVKAGGGKRRSKP